MRRLLATITLMAVLGAAGAADASAARSAGAGYDTLVRRTEHGIPHVVADGDSGIGFGYGYVVARDHTCLLAESYATVAGERSKFFGPDGEFVFHANGARHSNLASDLFYRQVNSSGVIERLLRTPPPVGVDRRVQALVRGYVAGYNRYLREVGVDRISDPVCRGKPWVRPITEADAYRRFVQLASLAGGGLAITGIADAQPPGAAATTSREPRTGLLGELGRRLGLDGTGSNAVALGRAATRSGAGMLLGNPHLPWDGDGLLYHAHLTIPGRMDVSGATFIGVPFVIIGHTRRLAWSHTTSSAFRFTPFELRLAAGDPTTYLVDGQPKKMTNRTIVVPVRRSDGSTGEVRRTLWSTEYGPVLTSLLGLPLFPWTAQTAYAFADANAENLRYLNHFYAAGRARSVPELEAILKRYQGIPWANTLAADSAGRSFYADASVVPHVTNAQAAGCNTALGVAAYEQLRLPVLDGSRAGCGWGADPDAVQPGIFGPRSLPFLTRADYVENSNDSHWLSNPAQPLEGFAQIIGDERSERSLRTRLGLRMIRERLAGTDGRPGRGFTLAQLQDVMFDDRNGGAELVRDELVEMCRALPVLPSSRGAVVTGDACEVLARWDGRDRAESRGALLFRRFGERSLIPAVPGKNAVGGGAPPLGTWSDSFDPARPVDTPNRLNTASLTIQQALGDAVADLREAGIPLDARLGDFQYELRGGQRIAMHGGPGTLGVFNAYKLPWDRARGYPDVIHGGSFFMATELRGACPPTRTLLAYSQSSNPASRWHTDQTRMLSQRRWVTERYCERQVLGSRALRTRRLGCLPGRAGTDARRIAWLVPGVSARRAVLVLGRPDRRRRWGWCVAGGGGVRAGAFGKRSRRLRFVATTARAHRVAGARPGRRLRAKGWRPVGRGLRVRHVARRRAAVAALRGRRVRWVALVSARTARSPKRVAAFARSVGLRTSSGRP